MASIVKRCDCNGWNKCPHSWIVRYRTEGGRSGRQRERSFGGDLGEAEDFVLKVAHGQKARAFIDPEAGKAVFRAEAERWLSQRIGADSSDMTYKSVLRTHIYPAIGHQQIRTIRREEIKEIIAGMRRKAMICHRVAMTCWYPAIWSALARVMPSSGSRFLPRAAAGWRSRAGLSLH